MWFVDETYVKVAGRWTYLYRAVDQHGQVIDVLVWRRWDASAARAFFARALKSGPAPDEVSTDRAPVYPRVIDECVPVARDIVEQYANKRVESDHAPPQSPVATDVCHDDDQIFAHDRGRARVRANLRRGHDELTVDRPAPDARAAWYRVKSLRSGHPTQQSP